MEEVIGLSMSTSLEESEPFILNQINKQVAYPDSIQWINKPQLTITRPRGKQVPSTGLRRLAEGDAKTAHRAVSIHSALLIAGPLGGIS
jgi:hypothetical protein